jgi:hypothetical protein
MPGAGVQKLAFTGEEPDVPGGAVGGANNSVVVVAY